MISCHLYLNGCCKAGRNASFYKVREKVGEENVLSSLDEVLEKFNQYVELNSNEANLVLVIYDDETMKEVERWRRALLTLRDSNIHHFCRFLGDALYRYMRFKEGEDL